MLKSLKFLEEFLKGSAPADGILPFPLVNYSMTALPIVIRINIRTNFHGDNSRDVEVLCLSSFSDEPLSLMG